MNTPEIKNTWRSFLLPEIRPQEGLNEVYEFGVFTGASMIELHNLFADKGVDLLVGFDSFEGVPKETAEPIYQPVWDPEISDYYKAFNASVFFETDEREIAVNNVWEVITPYVNAMDVCLIPGWYDQVLTPEMSAAFGKPLYVDIDVDIYSSAYTVLDWLFENQIMQSGTYVGYDDWGGTPGHVNFEDGESRAHKEVTEKYEVEWERVSTYHDDKPDSQQLWQVKSYSPV